MSRQLATADREGERGPWGERRLHTLWGCASRPCGPVGQRGGRAARPAVSHLASSRDGPGDIRVPGLKHFTQPLGGGEEAGSAAAWRYGDSVQMRGWGAGWGGRLCPGGLRPTDEGHGFPRHGGKVRGASCRLRHQRRAGASGRGAVRAGTGSGPRRPADAAALGASVHVGDTSAVALRADA